MLAISSSSTVILHINMKLTDGSVADSTRVSHLPAKIMMGSGDVTVSFEQALLGLHVGDKRSFPLPPEQAFGWPNPANIHRFPRSRFHQNIHLEKDQIIECEQLNGIPLLGIIRDWNEDEVTLDFNHPLCGQTVIFEVEILEVQA